MTHRPPKRPRRTLWWVLWDAYQKISRIDRKVDQIMTAQEQANALAERLAVATDGIRQDIADLKAANPEVDFSALEQRVAGLEGLDAENPGPAEPPTE